MGRGDESYILAGEYASYYVVDGFKREDYLSAVLEAAFMTGFHLD